MGGCLGITVDLWVWALRPGDSDELERFVSMEERARAARFVDPERGALYTCAHGLMRRALSAYSAARPEDLCFETGAYGKPALKGGPHFNLSHSGRWAVLAVCWDGPVGVDVECHRPYDHGIVAHFFSEGEQAELSGVPEQDQAEAFFRVWSRKEAVIKELGFGLSMPLDSFDVSAGHEALLRRMAPEYGNAADWRMHSFQPAVQVAGAIAVRTFGQPIHVRQRAGETLA
jgi:4'-phosphopantetheinyl transferase